MLNWLSEPFLATALGVGLLSAGLCAYVGNFVLMKDMTFIAMALSEMAAVGVALGLLADWNPNLTGLAATLAGVLFFWHRARSGRGTTEGLIALIYVASAALVLILISQNPRLEAHGIDLLSGNLLYSTTTDLVVLGAVAAGIGVLHVMFRREFLFVGMDPETAATLGVKASRFDLLLLLTIGAAIAVSLKLTGILFVFGSLIIPGLTALLWAGRVTAVFAGSVLVAAVCVVLGMGVSYGWDLPSSPAILCTYALAYAAAATASWLRRRVRGIRLPP